MSSQDRKAKAAAAASRSNRGANAFVVGGIVVIIAMVVIVSGAIWATTQSGGVDSASELPQGVEEGQPFEPYAGTNPPEDAPVVDVYEDFRCPACKGFEQATGETITQLAEDGEIRLRVHLKTVIDSLTGGESSAVAGSSAICAADQGKWTEYHKALFALQPASETKDGFAEETYTEAAKMAGLSGDDLAAWQQCTDAHSYVDYVQSVDDASVQDGITGTPVIEVEGTRLNWGGLIDQEKQQVDTDRLKQILTSGKVPEDLVATQ
ncbi:DsbA family protein [Janibacter cremeus]|uniref:Protein-disulfide isomerase n=1 Tax=Janibacter cremeus TaxID=1285192 RepID=A0A852W0S9_9MICO|nr:thioredoxin domain-containing protein [Janibacter cremeus]NYF99585.1 protein-disulfide isomerase [Janibacter cremeus]